MILTNKSLNNTSEKRMFKIPNRIVGSPKRKKQNEIDIISPNICPICGKTDIEENYKLKSRSYNFRKFILIFICGSHIQMRKKTKFSNLFYFILIFLTLIISALIFLKIIPISFITLFIFLIIPIFCVFITFHIIKGGNRLTMDQKFVNKFIILKSYRNYSIISIKRQDWANQFKNLNKTSEYILDIELIEVLKIKRKQTAIHIGINIIICISGILISAILYNLSIITTYIIFETIAYIFYYLLMGATIFFIIKIGYYTMKIHGMEY